MKELKMCFFFTPRTIYSIMNRHEYYNMIRETISSPNSRPQDRLHIQITMM